MLVTHTSDSSSLGRRVEVPWARSVEIGSSGCGVVLAAEDEVEPRHAVLAWRGDQVWLTAHAPNILVEGEPVRGRAVVVPGGARIDVGGACVSLIASEGVGGGVEAAYHEIICRLTIEDFVTGLPNARYFDENLARCARDASFEGVVVTLRGSIAGGAFERNRALERVAAILKDEAADLFAARTGAVSISLLCAGREAAIAEARARELLGRLDDEWSVVRVGAACPGEWGADGAPTAGRA